MTADPPRRDPPVRERRRRRLLLIPLALLLVALAAAAAARFGDLPLPANPFRAPAAGETTRDVPSTSLYRVGPRRDLSSQTSTTGTLGYAGSYTIVNEATGIVTSLPAVGQIVGQGQVLYRVDASPVVLLYGSTPAYRTLSGAGGSGPDVEELNADLVALGYVTGGELSPTSDRFGYWTCVGVADLQAALGVDQTGALALGQVVFLPGAARITSVRGSLGASVGAGQPLLSASSTTRQVTVNLNADQESELAVGDTVGIGLPNGRTTPGTVTSIGSVASSGSQGGPPTVPVVVRPADPGAAGSLDAAPVDITITERSVRNALVVPVAALLARPGGYVVEVAGGHGRRRLVPVSLGLFDDAGGLVQVTDTSLRPGQLVVTAST